MEFGAPMTFSEAVRHLAAKRLLPTGLDSAGLRALEAGLRRQALFSARTLSEELLANYREKITSIINPEQVERAGQERTVTEGYNPATARAALKELLAEMGYEPEAGKAGTIQDFSSDARINLVVDTNVKLAQGAGRFVQQNLNPDVVDLWPALELVRFEPRERERDWGQRWRIAAMVARDARAAGALGLHGRMAALKSSGIWQALGDGEGGFNDTLGNPYPPFAFRSGMWTVELDRGEAEELGLLAEGEAAAAADFDLAELFAGAE